MLIIVTCYKFQKNTYNHDCSIECNQIKSMNTHISARVRMTRRNWSRYGIPKKNRNSCKKCKIWISEVKDLEIGYPFLVEVLQLNLFIIDYLVMCCLLVAHNSCTKYTIAWGKVWRGVGLLFCRPEELSPRKCQGNGTTLLPYALVPNLEGRGLETDLGWSAQTLNF